MFNLLSLFFLLFSLIPAIALPTNITNITNITPNPILAPPQPTCIRRRSFLTPLNLAHCLAALQLVRHEPDFDSPRTWTYHPHSPWLMRRWVEGECLIGLLGEQGARVGVVEDVFAIAEIAQAAEEVVERCVVEGEKVGGRRIVGCKVIFEVVVVDKTIFSRASWWGDVA